MKSVKVAVLALFISAPSFASISENPNAVCEAKAGPALWQSTKSKKSINGTTPQTIIETKVRSQGSAS